MFSVTKKKLETKEDGEAETDNYDSENDEGVEEITEKSFEEKKTEKMVEVIKAMTGIKNCQNDRTPEGYLTDSLREDIHTVNNTYFAFKKHKIKLRYQYRNEVAKNCLDEQNNTVVIFCNIIKDILKNGYRNAEGKAIPGMYRPLRNMLGFMQNMTDFHSQFRKKVTEQTEFLKVLIQKLHEWAEPHLKKELKDNDNMLLGVVLGILHNVAQEEENIPPLREVNVIDASKPYLDAHTEMKRLTSLAILADVVNEEESQILQRNSDSISFIINTLKSAVRSKTRRCHGWAAKEIARTIRMIARNDSNKRTVFTHGAVPLLVELAETAKNTKEQTEAVGALWTLSFDQQNQAEMILDQECTAIDTLHKLAESNRDDVRRICRKALWTMKDRLKLSERYKSIGEKFSVPQTPRKGQDENHVMISYNWGHQAIVKQICSNLRNNGIKVWMDVDDMQGSTLQAMASAVEKADIVLVCFSQKYKNSDNCRAEAEYAFQLKKKIIPLKMEKGYIADGWLGFIIGAKLFFDFGGKYPFENKVKDLIKEVQVSLNTVKGLKTEVAVPEVKVQVAPSVQSQPQPQQALRPPRSPGVDLDKVRKWTPQHVGKWLDKNKLPRNLLQRLSGIEVAFLHVLVIECPEIYYKTIADQLAVKDILTMAKLRFALEALDVNI